MADPITLESLMDLLCKVEWAHETYLHAWRAGHGQAEALRLKWAGAQKDLTASHAALVAERDAMREGIDNALSALGTGKCTVNKCEGCQYEVQFAIGELRAALLKEPGHG